MIEAIISTAAILLMVVTMVMLSIKSKRHKALSVASASLLIISIITVAVIGGDSEIASVFALMWIVGMTAGLVRLFLIFYEKYFDCDINALT